MSLTAVRGYFRSRLTSLGFTEWADPFGSDNLPSTVLDRSFHQEIGPASGVAQTQGDLELDASVTIRLFFKGFREPETALDEAILKAEVTLLDLVWPPNYEHVTTLHGVFLNSVSFEPLTLDTNDNVVVAVLNFQVKTYICL